MNKPQARKYFVRHPNRTLKYIVTWTKTRTHIAQSKDIRRGSQKQLPRHCLFSTARNILSNILHRGYSLPFVFTIFFFFFYLLSIIFIQRREKKSNISLMTSPTMWKSWGNLHRLWCQNALFWTKRNNASVRLRLLLLLFGSFGLYERYMVHFLALASTIYLSRIQNAFHFGNLRYAIANIFRTLNLVNVRGCFDSFHFIYFTFRKLFVCCQCCHGYVCARNTMGWLIYICVCNSLPMQHAEHDIKIPRSEQQQRK